MIDVVFTLDTTGSMSPCLHQARRRIVETVDEMFAAIPGLQIGMVFHGCYCDAPNTISKLGLTADKKRIISFVNTTNSTGGGDSPEAYELALQAANEMDWRLKAKKAVVVIGDEVPHEVGAYTGGHWVKVSWLDELDRLTSRDMTVFGVQCLGRRHATKFYESLAKETGGVRLELNQFSDVAGLIQGVCYQQAGQLDEFEKLLAATGRKTPGIVYITDLLAGRKPSVMPGFSSPAARVAHKLSDTLVGGTTWEEVNPSRFQVLAVDHDCSIKDFVVRNDLIFKTGRGFYELTKPVLVQSYKEVIAQEKATGKFFTGTKARELFGIPVGEDAKIRPTSLRDHRCFIQSTSANRKLLGGTAFLYEVDLSR